MNINPGTEAAHNQSFILEVQQSSKDLLNGILIDGLNIDDAILQINNNIEFDRGSNTIYGFSEAVVYNYAWIKKAFDLNLIDLEKVPLDYNLCVGLHDQVDQLRSRGRYISEEQIRTFINFLIAKKILDTPIVERNKKTKQIIFKEASIETELKQRNRAIHERRTASHYLDVTSSHPNRDFNYNSLFSVASSYLDLMDKLEFDFHRIESIRKPLHYAVEYSHKHGKSARRYAETLSLSLFPPDKTLACVEGLIDSYQQLLIDTDSYTYLYRPAKLSFLQNYILGLYPELRLQSTWDLIARVTESHLSPYWATINNVCLNYLVLASPNSKKRVLAGVVPEFNISFRNQRFNPIFYSRSKDINSHINTLRLIGPYICPIGHHLIATSNKVGNSDFSERMLDLFFQTFNRCDDGRKGEDSIFFFFMPSRFRRSHTTEYVRKNSAIFIENAYNRKPLVPYNLFVNGRFRNEADRIAVESVMKVVGRKFINSQSDIAESAKTRWALLLYRSPCKDILLDYIDRVLDSPALAERIYNSINS